jgi:hypothetical protein
MVAGVSLEVVVNLIGPKGDDGTHTKHLVEALSKLGVKCATKLRRVSRQRPVLPSRAIVAIHGPKKRKWHWLLHWEGKIYDPDGCWPALYKDWRMTSFLEIEV